MQDHEGLQTTSVSRSPDSHFHIRTSVLLNLRKHVIHAVGPIYAAYEESESATLLASAYHESLKLAVQYNLRSIVSLRNSVYLRFCGS